MSSSQPSGDPAYQNDIHVEDDYPMMEAPDSPPETTQHTSIANHSATLSGAQGTSGNRVTSETKTNHGAPGSSWNNKKWHDECERYNATLLDPHYNQAAFGDPLLEA